jgi:2,4-dienoyl-CoA reductase-like NADH-dependent reductase (Old Yellow Enzyme family)
MAPLTRARATGPGRVPNELMARYYAQRSGAGLIISEATCVSPMGVGYSNTPGIWSIEQIEGWKKITSAVHLKGGKIFLQLWHVGRISHPVFLNGLTPVAPSAVKPQGHVSLIRPVTEYVTPRELRLIEIKEIVEDFRKGALNAQLAGFDGVEIHGANGYLLDQFLQDGTNQRKDEYGGPIENRARLLLEVTDAVISVWGAERVGVHLSPRGDAHDMKDSDPKKTFLYVAEELGNRKIAFIFVREYQADNSLGPQLKEAFGGVFIANEKFTKETAEKAIADGHADAVAFGIQFIANPDLPDRFLANRVLNDPDFSTFYADGEVGYTDYPTF